MTSREGAGPGEVLRTWWGRLSPLPGGKTLFAFLFGRMVPYSGSVHPRIEELSPGNARVSIPDRRSNRNHLRSVHAIALMNVAEISSGLALLAALPRGARGILVGLSIEYVKKSRGTITASCRAAESFPAERAEHLLRSVLTDAAGDVVARAEARWLVGPEA